MPSPAYERFERSMHIGYEEWHDGIGYDLSALAELTADERASVEALLISRLSGSADWRDIEALGELKTPEAVAAIDRARKHSNAEVRKHALQYFLEPEAEAQADPAQVEEQIAHEVERGAIDLAQRHPTPRVKRALLDCARLGNPTQRVNAAAMLMYLCGQAPEPFDWNQRPFFLRFNAEGHDLYVVWHELKKCVGL
jgi:hypothetical protein